MSTAIALPRRIAANHPYLFFVTIAYSWSWPFWWLAYFLENLAPGMKLALVLLGVFGPALAGITLLRLRNDKPVEHVAGRLPYFLLGVALASLAIAAFRFDFMGVLALVPSEDLTVTSETPWYVYIMLIGVVTLSGFVFSQVRSGDGSVRAFLGGLVPDRRAMLLAVPVVLFLPTLMVGASALSDLAGIPYDTPRYQAMSVQAWLPLMLVKLFTVAMLTGGNEEYGWRGVLLPLLQQRHSAAVATILVALVWEPWHIPLTLDLSGSNENYALIMVARFVMIFPIAFMLTMLYNFSRGSIFLCILLHACFNTCIPLFGGSALFALGLLMTVAIGIVLFKMWRKGRGFVPGDGNQ